MPSQNESVDLETLLPAREQIIFGCQENLPNYNGKTRPSVFLLSIGIIITIILLLKGYISF